MIVITGAAGFIASFLAEQFNKDNENDLILVDDFTKENKKVNHLDLNCHKKIDRSEFIEWFNSNGHIVDYVIHLRRKNGYHRNGLIASFLAEQFNKRQDSYF